MKSGVWQVGGHFLDLVFSGFTAGSSLAPLFFACCASAGTTSRKIFPALGQCCGRPLARHTSTSISGSPGGSVRRGRGRRPWRGWIEGGSVWKRGGRMVPWLCRRERSPALRGRNLTRDIRVDGAPRCIGPDWETGRVVFFSCLWTPLRCLQKSRGSAFFSFAFLTVGWGGEG